MGLTIGVIGAGAAGLMAAGRAAELGHDVILFEKKNRAGLKLLITGKGRCNITNTCETTELMDNIPGNGRFLHSAFSQFSITEIMDFFEQHGVPVKEERGGRVFPVSDDASDVVEALVSYAYDNGVRFRFNCPVRAIEAEDGHVTGVRLDGDEFVALDAVILTTGGLSYPGTGSTGDGYAMAQALGHTLVQPKPSLVPLTTQERWVSDLSGLSLRNVEVSFTTKDGKPVYKEFGEMLFTHFGVSGPVILSASRHLLDHGFAGHRMYIDLKPALDEEKLDLRIQRDFAEFSRKQFQNALDKLLPKSLIPVMVMLSGIHPEKPVNQISREERLNLVRLFKALPLSISGSRPVSEAIVTAGGISIREVRPSTMESKLVQGLYLAGEILDVDAYTGGFNLTIAFSTGYCAGSALGV